MPYTKLFNSIVTSSLWLESDQTRLVWITMLALADKHGEVQASVPGLARLAGVPVDSCRTALAALSSPDPDSRTKTLEGRRILEIDGGWELVNHAKYRRMASEEDKREANAARQARHRERHGVVTHSNGASRGSNGDVTPDDHKQSTEAHPEAEAEAPTPGANAPSESSGSKPSRRRPRLPLNCPAFAEFWRAYPKREGKGAAEAAWLSRGCAQLLPQILMAVRKAKSSPGWTKDAGQFIPHPATWLNRRGWEDEPTDRLAPVMGTKGNPLL